MGSRIRAMHQPPTLLLALSPALAQTNDVLNILPVSSPNTTEAQQAIDRQGPVFIENRGQWDRHVKFLMRSGGLDMWITDRGVRYDLYRLDRKSISRRLLTSPAQGTSR